MISPLARLLAVTSIFWAIAFAGPWAEAQERPTGAALAVLLAKFDAYAESSRQLWGVPGMAVAVIQGKNVVFSKGYGVRVQGEPAAVDTSTVFQIGSISKSFTATVMGSLVDEGKVAFEDHVIDRYPGFQMYDPWVTREFMIWDLMAQHSGMAPLYHARPAKDYASAFLADAKAKAEAGKFPSPPANPAPGRDPGAYAGTYRSVYFGPLVAEVQGSGLLLSMGPRKTPVRLKHWDGDTFAISLPGYGTPRYTDGFVTFVFGEAGQALELRFIRGFDDADDGRFTRVANR